MSAFTFRLTLSCVGGTGGKVTVTSGPWNVPFSQPGRFFAIDTNPSQIGLDSYVFEGTISGRKATGLLTLTGFYDAEGKAVAEGLPDVRRCFASRVPFAAKKV